MGWVVLLLLVVGCTFRPPSVATDAPGDTPPDMDPNCAEKWTTRAGHVPNVCLTPPDGGWTIDLIATYNTDDGSYTGGDPPRSYLIDQPSGSKLRVVSVADLTVNAGATLRVVGQHPLLVLSWSRITVSGGIDVSSKRLLTPGAGANLQGCNLADAGDGIVSGGGGGGGGFKDRGGLGGSGNNDGNMGGGIGNSISRPEAYVRGGCAGGTGGTGAGASAGGAGGGAVQLTAKESITVTSTGVIHAGGMGGQGSQGASGTGGGGGGSGGFIGLDAPAITTEMSSALAANGGGGGAGCESGDGAPGEDGWPNTNPARGGVLTSCFNGAAGGDGGRRSGVMGLNGAPGIGGGGGAGGGVGYIVIWVPSMGDFTRNGLESPFAELEHSIEP